MRDLLRRLVADQRIRFLAVGGTNTVVSYLVFAACNQFLVPHLRFGYLLSLVISYVIGVLLAFVLYRRFVFVVHGNVLVDFLRFVGVYVVSISINIVLLPILVEGAKLPALLAQAICVVVTTVISFVGHRYFSFRRRSD